MRVHYLCVGLMYGDANVSIRHQIGLVTEWVLSLLCAALPGHRHPRTILPPLVMLARLKGDSDKIKLYIHIRYFRHLRFEF